MQQRPAGIDLHVDQRRRISEIAGHIGRVGCLFHGIQHRLRRGSQRLIVGRLDVHGQIGTIKPLTGGAERDGSYACQRVQAILDSLLQSNLVSIGIGRHGVGGAVRPASPAE